MQNKQKLPKNIKNQKKVKVGKFAHFRSHATLCERKFYSGLLYLHISKKYIDNFKKSVIFKYNK